jgi:DNA-binding NtrC family response regulator
MKNSSDLNEWVKEMSQVLGGEDSMAPPAPESPALRVLMVDDDPVDRMAMKRSLNGVSGVSEVLEAESLREARDLLFTNLVDVFLLDYNLPDGDSLTFAGDLLARNISVVLVTGAGNEEVAVRALRTGCHDYLIKDVGGNYLSVLPNRLQKLRKYLTLERQRDALLHRVSKDYKKIGALRKMIPICSSCKAVRATDGSWHPVEEYLTEQRKLSLTHSYCPTCMEKLEAEFDNEL